MKKFDSFITEARQVNAHMEHMEDLMFNEGVDGTRKAINFLRDLRDMLAGNSRSKITATVKFDGAPAVFIGVDPADGKFFVAKKGLFNKNPKLYKTPEDVKADTSGDLQAKLLDSLEHFSKLGLKSGVYQGDLMFTSSDLKKQKIDGKHHYTFQPNTIMYAVPVDTPLGRAIGRAKIGVVWHTTYTGNSIADMSASFGQDIVSKLGSNRDVWQTDATYKDVSGAATFTAAETKQINEILSDIGRLFNKIPAALLNTFKENPELLLRVKTYNNTHIRAGRIVSPMKHTQGLMDYIHEYYQKQIDSKKTDAGKKTWIDKRNDMLSLFTTYTKAQISSVFELMNMMVRAKGMIVGKMNQAGGLGTFLTTRNGLKVTGQEGFVAIDHTSGGAVKIVDRMEFSWANFSPEIIKGFDKRG